MKTVHPLLQTNALGKARRRRLVEKFLRALHVKRSTAVHLSNYMH